MQNGRFNQSNNMMTMGQKVALWSGILSTMIAAPYLWRIADWISMNLFVPQWGSELSGILIFAVFGVICMIALSLARMGFGTTIAMMLIFFLSKLPII